MPGPRAIGESRPAKGAAAPALEAPPAPAEAPDGHLAPAHPRPSPQVLLLYGEPRLTPAIVAVDGAIRSTLESGPSAPVTFYTEYLDLTLFEGAVPLPALRELLRLKYQTRHIDLIVAAGSRPLRIALHNRAELFSNAPVVFVGVDPTAASDLRAGPDVTGTWLHMGWAETLDLARRLEPETRRAVVVNGSSPVDGVWMAEAKKQLAAEAQPLEITYLTGSSREDVLAQVHVLPKQTVVLVGTFFRDATGRDFTTPEVITRIAAAASVPVYALTEAVVGTGIVGGHVVRFELHGKAAGELALRVLAGEHPAPTDTGTTEPMLDARQLARRRFDERRLPPGSRILFREPSVWTTYRWYIAGAAAALLVQSGLISGLLMQRARRRRAEQHLAERLRFETLLSKLSAILAGSPPAGVEAHIASALEHLVEGLGVDWAAVHTFELHGTQLWLTHAWSRADVSSRPKVIREDEAPWIFAELRQRRIVRLAGLQDAPHDATADQLRLEAFGARSIVAAPLVAGDSVVGGLSLGTAREDRAWPDEWTPRLELLAEAFASALERQRAARTARESQEAIRGLAGRLMTAQEEERRSIARDLHDDVSQELAAQAIALSTLGNRVPDDTTPAVRQEIARLHARTVEVASAIRHLSHSLHPGILQHAGLVAALRGYCRAFGHEQNLEVTFRADGEFGVVPPDVALCLYRVTQEGLGNIARHAAARHASVTMALDERDVVLTIGDDGSGFDPADARYRHGLGLISLHERVRLVGGRLTIASRPQRGTELRVAVPVPEFQNAPRDRAAR